MVEEGIGYALRIDKLVYTTNVINLCFKPLEPSLEASLNIVWKKYQVFSKAVEKFLKELQKAYHVYTWEKMVAVRRVHMGDKKMMITAEDEMQRCFTAEGEIREIGVIVDRGM